MIRLLSRDASGSLVLHQFHKPHIPPYAILSHTWNPDNSKEVLFEDLENGRADTKLEYRKIEFCEKRAVADGLTYFWIDTCCINKRSENEVTEAINSMFRWYRDAVCCYVYLTDVPAKVDLRDGGIVFDESTLRQSRWFTRGWTLQELIAPKKVEFFGSSGESLGNRRTLEDLICKVTGISKKALRGHPLAEIDLSERWLWAAKRETTREEDIAYCMLGIFDISMPMIYGEGKERALDRLHAEASKPKRQADTAGSDFIEPNPKRARTQANELPILQQDSKPAIQELIDLLSFDQINDRLENIKPSLAKTCQWLLEEDAYSSWLNSQNYYQTHGFFWIKGKPGCGKSTLTKFAFTQVKKHPRNELVLSFFFNARGTDLEKSTAGLYRSFIVQMLLSQPKDHKVYNLPGGTARTLNEGCGWDLMKLKELLRELLHSISRDVIVIVDALDETDEDDIRDMIDDFEDLGEQSAANGREFRVLFSSRHYPNITAQRSVQLILENLSGHSQDIERYISSKFKALKGKKAESIKQELQAKASGIFLWVVLVVDILNRSVDHGRIHTLRKKLQEIPADLNELFRTILIRDRENMDDMKLCLQWILYAMRPLNCRELYFAILSDPDHEYIDLLDDVYESSEEDMEKFILSSSKGLAEISKSKARNVQFIHESVRDFLLKEHGFAKIWPDLIDNPAAQSHETLKRCCYHYFTSVSRSESALLKPKPRTSSKERAEDRKACLYNYPFLDYAARGLFAHADVAQREGLDQKDYLQHFPLQEWIKLNNLIERYDVRRYTGKGGLPYILAERNYPHLARIVWRDGSTEFSRGERYDNPVFAALAANSLEALEVILEHDAKDYPEGRCCLTVRDSNIKALKKLKLELLVKLLSVYEITDNGARESSIELAAEKGLYSIMELLVKRESRSDTYTRRTNALYLAALHGHNVILKCLLDIGVSVDEPSTRFENRTALMAAAAGGHVELVRHLLERGADVNARAANGYNVLEAAARHGHINIVKLILREGVDVYDLINNSGLLEAASSGGYKDIVELLLDAGTDIEMDGMKVGRALWAASWYGLRDTVKLLLERGAKIDGCGEINRSALQAASYGGHRDTVALLLDRGADINLISTEDGSALQAASQRGHVEIVKLLIERGAVVNAAEEDSRYGSALHAATWWGREEVVRLLLNAGADVNRQSGKYGSALQAASCGGSLGVVRILLEEGADINAQGGMYGNALRGASMSSWGHRDAIIKLLLGKGADVEADGAGRGSALQAALDNRDVEIIKLLQPYANGSHAMARSTSSSVETRVQGLGGGNMPVLGKETGGVIELSQSPPTVEFGD